MKSVYLRGVGLWTPGYASAEAWCRGDADPAAPKPEAKLLEGSLRRRASPLTRMSAEVFEQVATTSNRDVSEITTVWATAHGEHSTAIKLLKMMRRGEGKVSPTHFHNSVHNTPSGYASIATGNGSPSTTLTGGPELVASSLLEAFGHLAGGAREVVVVLADEPLQAPFDRPDMQWPLALAFCLSSEPDGSLVQLKDLRRKTVPAIKLHERFGTLYVSAGLPLLECAVARKPGTVALELDCVGQGEAAIWCVDLELIEG